MPHLGAVGNWIKTAGTPILLVVGEILKDSEKRWR